MVGLTPLQGGMSNPADNPGPRHPDPGAALHLLGGF